MPYLYLSCLIAGLLLGVRLMFFGAERRRAQAQGIPLRRSEPAVVSFLTMFGLAGYLLQRHSSWSGLASGVAALLLGAAWALLMTRVAIATASLTPEHDPDDPRYVLQGTVGVVSNAIPANGSGAITFPDGTATRSVAARSLDGRPVEAGEEVCIERIDEGVAWVELWTAVESRL